MGRPMNSDSFMSRPIYPFMERLMDFCMDQM